MYFGIVVYTALWMLAWLLVYYHSQHKLIFTYGYKSAKIRRFTGTKMPILTALIISFIFTLFNVYATNVSVVIGGDRQNYILNFNGVRNTPSVGLQFIFDVVHHFGGNMHSVYYLTTFFCVFITMIAYKASKKANPFCFYLLCITQYFLMTLTALKQSYASALAILFFVLVIEYKTKVANLVAILCMILACLFHPTGYVLIIVYFALRFVKNKKNIILYSIILFIVALFFKQVMLLGATIVHPVFPSLASKIAEYFATEGSLTQDVLALSFIKGIPYYLIAILGICKRKELINHIENYDKYLIVTATGAFIYLMSMYNGWLERFVYLFSFTSFIFFSEILRKMWNRNNRFICSTLVQICLWVTTYRFLFLVYYNYGGF